jgi:membrane-bound ClpP family serine protease
LSDETFLDYLNKHPQLRSRFESLLLLVMDEKDELQEADAAELQLIEQMRRMGQESLQVWASEQVVKAAEQVEQENGVRRAGKKNSVAQHLR